MQDCWLYEHAVNQATGYASVPTSPRGSGHTYTHRLAWEIVNGPIPAGLQVDHLCRQPTCINPNHMRLLSHVEHSSASARDRWVTVGSGDTCRRGHVGEYVRRLTDGRPYCRACERERYRLRTGGGDNRGEAQREAS